MLLTEAIKIYIEYNGLSIKEILNLLCSSENYNLLEFLSELEMNADTDYINTVKKVFSNNCKIMYIDNEDINNLKGFLLMLGRSDVKGQISNCNLYKKLFEKKYLQLEENQQKNCKNTVVFISGFSLLISIVFI